MPAALSDEQRRTLYRDGFVVVPQQIPPELIAAARRAIYRNIGRANNSALNFASDPARSVRNSTRGDGLEGGEDGLAAAKRASGSLPADPVVTDLFSATGAADCVTQLLGARPRQPKYGQVAVNFPSSEPTSFVGQNGFPDDEVPFWGANLHVDGCWNGGSTPPQTAEEDATAHYHPVGTNGGLMERRRDDAAEVPTNVKW